MTSLALLLGVAWCLHRAGQGLVRVLLEDQRPWFLCLSPREVPGALLCLAVGGRHRKVLLEILHARAEARRPLYPRVPSRPLPPPGGWTAGQRSYPVHSPVHLEAARRRAAGGLERGMTGASAECGRPWRPEELRPGVHQERVCRPGRLVTWRWSVDMSGRCLCADCKELRARNSVAVPRVSPAVQAMTVADLFAAMEELTGTFRRYQGIPPPVIGDLPSRDFTHHESRLGSSGDT